MTALTVSGLTEQQRALVKYLVVEGKPPEEAAKLAGYHPKSAYRTLRLPAVAAAISETIQLDLASVGAPLAYRKETPAQKALSEMSREELAAFIDRNEKEIDRIEGELGARAKDVSPDSMYK